ncbi:hypothetical protein G4B88_014451 [Cannabis sativa]|uniref:Ubiquitin-like protease family profile domain-containing protein n=1 Tax=Cannabis sativa TaxID=3483 RepID=A0A7J6IA28_CANSA|nr:hypothetical protein G4B88_014451 [Cannabis sativa]
MLWNPRCGSDIQDLRKIAHATKKKYTTVSTKSERNRENRVEENTEWDYIYDQKNLHDKEKVYLKGKDKIVPPFRFGVEDVATKMWFHKLAYPGQCLTNSTESHWILGRLNIEERRVYMYNSLSTAMKDSAAIKACQPFAVLLPHFFALFDEFKKENKPVCLDPFEVVKVDGLPQQTSNDCGCFVASFAEYFIDMKPIPPIFDVEKHRDRLAVLFYKYARMKEVEFIDSEDEAPPKVMTAYY